MLAGNFKWMGVQNLKEFFKVIASIEIFENHWMK